MLTVVIKRSDEPTVIQMTQENVMRELSSVHGSEMLLEDTWLQGIRRVRTPYFCLLEPDCTLSAAYVASNIGITKKLQRGSDAGGGYNKMAMLSSCIGFKRFDDRIYNYELSKVLDHITEDCELKITGLVPSREKRGSEPYLVQVGFVPGAIIRFSAVKDGIDKIYWDDNNPVRLSAEVSLHFWNSNRRILMNPNTTYVSLNKQIPLDYKGKIEANLYPAVNIFQKERIGIL